MAAKLTGKDGVVINEDDVVLLQEHYYRVYEVSNRQWDAISCTNGYLHNITASLAAQGVVIGPYAQHAALLVCD